MRLLITGLDGFVGRHLARQAAEAGHEVFGIVQRPLANDDALHEHVTDVQACDLTQSRPRVETDAVVHLAGLAAVGPSFADPQRYISANSAMFTNVAESALEASPNARIIAVSSGALYGSEEGLVDETRPIHMTSPYVVSKRLVELQAEYYTNRGLDVIVARPFNHIGPGQGPGFLVPDLARQLLSLRLGEPILSGNLSTERDYSDVRDVASAYLALLATPAPSYRLFNIAGGAARSGREVFAELCRALGIVEPEVVVDTSRVRAADPPTIAGDSSRLQAATGWTPAFDFAVSVTNFVEEFRASSP